MAFIDECKITFKAGNGGDGIVAWRREAHVPLGGPHGGNGGNGGSIILVGDYNENSLQTLKYAKIIRTEAGSRGSIKNQIGKNGDDLYIKVPIGVIAYDVNTDQKIVDITRNGQQYIIAHGGYKGRGNFSFKSGMNKAPSLYELGDLGEVREVRLVLKQIADIGIVGLPNAGKSTFISKISAAKPKIANYHFTTLIPVLGTIYIENKKIIFADIPGLIEGAATGHGLGHNFLKHIERTKVLIHLISMEDSSEGVIKNYEIIQQELEKYSCALSEKPMILVANKMDLPEAESNYKILSDYLTGTKIIKASTLNYENLDEIVQVAYQKLMWVKEHEIMPMEEVQIIEIKQTIVSQLDHEVKIIKIKDHVFDVECEFLKYWAHKVPINTQDNVIRFNQKMKSVELEQKLFAAGARQNDNIIIYDLNLNFDE